MSEKITFKQLVELISSQAEQSQDSTHTFIQELVGIIETGLKNKGSVSISGFGKFELRWMNERSGVNPQTGEEITIPGQNKVVFKPYKALREHVNRPYANMEPQILSESTEEDDSKQNIVETEKKKKEPEEEDDLESDLLVERSSPISFPPLSGSSSDEKDDDDHLASVFQLSGETDKVKTEDSKKESEQPEASNKFESLPGETQNKSEPLPDESSKIPEHLFVAPKSDDRKRMTETVKESGSFNWSYAAAAIVVTLVILIILFLMMRPDPASETTALPETTQQELTQPADQAVRVTPAEPEPVVTEEPTPEPDVPPPTTIEHEINPGQSLWSIAEAEYGNPYLWPLIFESNSENLTNPNLIVAGSSISVPVIEDAQNLTPEESDMVAEGYYSLYQWSTVNNPDEARNFLWAVGNFSPDVLDKYSHEVDQNHLSFAKRQ